MQNLSAMIGWNMTEKKGVVGMATEIYSHFENIKDAGLIKVDYDPATQSREHVEFNTCFAGLWCMGKEELLLRFEEYNAPLPYSELDWLRNLIFDLETHFQNDTIRYSRLIFGSGEAARAVLVEITTSKSFNAVGQTCQVKQAYRVIGPTEYNRAVRSRPPCCPLPLTGDHRSGQRLLVDAAADSVLTVAVLSRSAPGRAKLAP
eukprot:CAMPEP_0172189854 /NCGR_PEP_ID=MMETSP1050-20130122/22768_1 /TAXON_ID=233186 /ORGANISM="Cryptomonas curvata, Strain CCAP979/52" /LENGTH=203 /DNA_ID=CAMNT_0012864621 /DNA_START=285 /DNA_END=893 /DNA_ORIENTATION=-